MQKLYQLFFLHAICIAKLFSSHLVGGELYYTKVGIDLYRLEFKAYRDCINGLVGFDDPLVISVFDSRNNFLGIISIPFTFAEKIPINPITPCAGIPTNVCVEETKYTALLRLPPIQGGYKLIYQRCCRNQTILNIEEPEYTGTTYYIQVLGNESPFFENSSPRFNNFPPVFICANEKLIFDHSATDPDGDSLVYELVTPWVGGDTSKSNARPIPTSVPPFQEIKWKYPFSFQNPMGGSDPITIDPNTGILSGTPPYVGQFVLGIAVSEYRNGVLIQKHIRDFQFNVVDCPPPPTAIIPDIINNCGNLVVFPNNSVSAMHFYWDFGDSTNPNDFSIEKYPSYRYPAPGTYKITLVASDQRPECADTAYANVIIIKNPKGADFIFKPVCEDQFLNLKDSSNFDIGNAIRWRWFVENKEIEDLEGKLLYKFKQFGTYNVKMVAYNEDGCADTIAKNVTIYPLPQILLKKKDTLCLGEQKSISVNTNAIRYYWHNSEALSCLDCLTPSVKAIREENFNLVFTAISSDSCVNTDTIAFFIPKAIPTYGKDTTVCFGKQATLRAKGGLFYKWSPSNLVTCETCSVTTTQITSPQKFFVEIRDRYNCKAYDSVMVRFFPLVSYRKSSDTSVCEGQSAKLYVKGEFKVSWLPKFSISCDTCLEVFTTPLFTNQTYKIELNDKNACQYTDSMKVNVVKNALNVPSDTTVCYGTTVSFRVDGAKKYVWKPGIYLSCDTCQRVTITPQSTVLYEVAGIDSAGCEFSKKFTVFVRRIIPKVEINHNKQRCKGTPIRFHATIDDYDHTCLGDMKLMWDFGDGVGKDSSLTPTYTFLNEGVYSIKLFVKGNDEPFVKEFYVYESDSCLKNIYIPNAFTPNNDGINDILYVRGINITDLLFKIYNNWGEEIFKTTSLHEGWDGTYKGQELKTQTFVYTCEATFYDGTKVFKEGNITLIR
jgi:gliding motility-associated-like protein